MNAISISNNIKVNGRENTSDAVCNAFNPPAIISTTAIAVINIPQIISPVSPGLRLPFDVMLPKIYVAESADVTRNVKIKNIASTDITSVNGRPTNVLNNTTDKSLLTTSAIFVPLFKSLNNAVPPKVAIHKQAGGSKRRIQIHGLFFPLIHEQRMYQQKVTMQWPMPSRISYTHAPTFPQIRG